jgi:hypothetical protein
MNIKKDAPYGVSSPSDIPGVADRILAEYFSLITEIGIKGCVILGICLGFYRDGAYLAGDNDLDVGAIVDDAGRKAVTDILILYGFLMGRTYPSNNTHFIKDGILLDVYWRRAEGYYAEFGSVEYKGKTYPIPAQTDAYLERCYGENWRVNDPDNDGSGYEG